MVEYPSDRRVIEAMARLRHDNDYQIIMTWLLLEKDAISRRAMIQSGDELSRMQGAYQALEQFLDYAKDAANVIEAEHERKKHRSKRNIP